MIIVIKDAFDGMSFPEAGDYGEAHKKGKRTLTGKATLSFALYLLWALLSDAIQTFYSTIPVLTSMMLINKNTFYFNQLPEETFNLKQ